MKESIIQAPRAVLPHLQPHPNVKNVLAVMSAKGGVGKSTVAHNLAFALHSQGAAVGLLDADIYGPSQPDLLGVVGSRPVITDDKKMLPVESGGVQSMSIGYLVEPDQAMIWRGPMVTQALMQLYEHTQWPKLDYLIIDMPPGTGDIALTLTQKIPVAGVVMVTTPQTLAVRDVARGVQMLNKVDVPVLGLVENLSVWDCSSCGASQSLTQNTALTDLYKNSQLACLGKLPFSFAVAEAGEQGQSVVEADAESSIAKAYIELATNTSQALGQRPRDYRQGLPGVKVV